MKKNREWFNLGEDHDNQNFIRIYLEHDDENEGVIFTEDGPHIYPVCFANRYVRAETDHSYGFDVEMGVYGTRVHYH